jgi:hypothetical protein
MSSWSEVGHLEDLDQATRRLGYVHTITVLLPPPCLLLPPHAMPVMIWGSGGEDKEMMSIPAGLHGQWDAWPYAGVIVDTDVAWT